jgi:dUTP pyrophosphatase
MQMVQVSIVNKSNNPLPAYATEGAAGMDIRANLESPVTLHSLERYLVPTGLYIELPAGYEAQMRPRSGLAIKQGITCLNSPGTIDSDYRGELKVVLDRIAQLVIGKAEQAQLVLVQQLNDTVRGEGGFGHTGIK